MMRLLLLILFLCSTAFGAEITLREKLGGAAPGSYLVTEQNKTYTFLHIHEHLHGAIVLEEVSIPSARFQQCGMNWRDWFESGAPGNTSWTLSQVNLETGKFEEAFSFTHNGWIDMSKSNNFLTTLLNLRFSEVPECYRRRIGSPPAHGKQDQRPIWNPRLIVGGIPVYQVPFTAWKARWPSDGSDLARKVLEIYIPIDPWEEGMPRYPTYFPYWVEVEGRLGSARVRVVDSGTGVSSPRSRLPRRSPQFLGSGVFTEDGLVLQLKSPSYFKDFLLLAEEADAFIAKPLSLPFTLEQDETKTTLKVDQKTLDELLTKGERYRFLLTPKDEPFFCIETQEPVAFINKGSTDFQQS